MFVSFTNDLTSLTVLVSIMLYLFSFMIWIKFIDNIKSQIDHLEKYANPIVVLEEAARTSTSIVIYYTLLNYLVKLKRQLRNIEREYVHRKYPQYMVKQNIF